MFINFWSTRLCLEQSKKNYVKQLVLFALLVLKKDFPPCLCFMKMMSLSISNFQINQKVLELRVGSSKCPSDTGWHKMNYDFMFGLAAKLDLCIFMFKTKWGNQTPTMPLTRWWNAPACVRGAALSGERTCTVYWSLFVFPPQHLFTYIHTYTPVCWHLIFCSYCSTSKQG